ncbi:MAG TPA: hypothetical protein VM580_28120, partial [Labilithrix sp.]|nr:hypothetical protein [Labilithrix sp.]
PDPEGKGAARTTVDAPAQAVPQLPSASLTEFGLRAFAGFDTIANVDGVQPAFGFAARFEARKFDSLFAPWVEGGLHATIYDVPSAGSSKEDSETGNLWDIALRGGVDIHPLRTRWVGVGPLVGYRHLHWRELEKSRMLQGVDIGGQVHFRTEEAATKRPAFDAIGYAFLQTAGLADEANRSFLGLLMSAGVGSTNSFRVFAKFEGCASSPGTCFPRQLHGSAGLGGAF